MKSIELFAGAGGLGLGVSRSGVEPISVIERDRHSCETIRANQERGFHLVSSWVLLDQDVRTIDFRLFDGQVDLVTGGPPCQPFSIGGRHKAHADVRDMFPEAVRAVREIRPRAFLFENVKGLTRQKFSTYLDYIVLQMTFPEIAPWDGEVWLEHLFRLEKYRASKGDKGLSYRVSVAVLNAADYGVPQKRERVFFVGFRSDLGVEWKFPRPTHSYDALLWDQKHGTYWDRHKLPLRHRLLSVRAARRADSLNERPALQPWRTVRDAIFDLPDPEFEPSRAAAYPNHIFQPGARRYVGHTGSPLDEPAKTLKAGVHGVPGGENMLQRSDASVRYFTVRESARLQTFPDEFWFQGSWSETMRQLGNAVPVDLAELISDHIRLHLQPSNVLVAAE